MDLGHFLDFLDLLDYCLFSMSAGEQTAPEELMNWMFLVRGLSQHQRTCCLLVVDSRVSEDRAETPLRAPREKSRALQ